MPELNRREFTAEAIRALFAGVAITITTTACGGGSSNPASPSGGSTSGDVSGSVSANHGHTAVLRRVDITAAGAVTLDITGSADHPHTVQLSAAQVTQIGGGQRVSVQSSEQQVHQHTVTFN